MCIRDRQETQYKYLDKVDSPDDLKRLCPGELTQYCAELRRFIIAQLLSLIHISTLPPHDSIIPAST